MFETVIIWKTGEKDIYKTNTRNEAEVILRNFKVAFGNQIEFACVRDRHHW